MRLRDRVAAFFGRRPSIYLPPALADLAEFDLPLRRAEATTRKADAVRESLMISPMAGMIDSDDYQFRRLSSGSKFKKRDLTPMQQDRMLEIAWYVYEQNPFGRRCVTAMTDLVVGEGLGFDAEDPKLLEAGQKVWNHPINRLGDRARELHNALALNGELILPCAVNDVTGVPVIGFIDPYQVEMILSRPDNVLVADTIVLKRQPGEVVGQQIKIIQENPVTGDLEGDCFYLGINKLPNSSRGRSDYLPLADWLDLFDQYMFAEVERVRLLGAFVWDLAIANANPEQIQARLAEIGTPQAGSVFAHNQNETLEACSPSLNATDRTETARLLTIHIAGSLGMPITWFGWPDSNRATIDGQNDVAMKTPAARQKEFGAFLNLILRFGIQRQKSANAVLFKNLGSDKFGVTMPEIAAKDITRVGSALAQIISGLDTAMTNRTVSRRVASVITLALTKHLGSGFDFKANDVMAEADADAAERQAHQDEVMANAAALAQKMGRGAGPNGRGNPPIGGAPPRPGVPKEGSIDDLPMIGPGAELEAALERMDERVSDMERRPQPQPVTVNAPVTVHPAEVHVAPAPVTVAAPHVETHAHVTMPKAGAVEKTFVLDTDKDSPTFGQLKGSIERPIAEGGDGQ